MTPYSQASHVFQREFEAINTRCPAQVEIPRRAPPSAPAVNGEGPHQLPLDVDCGRGVSRMGSPLRSRMAGGGGAVTVWRKSLLFNGNGFTVFDSEGNLALRVDNYASGRNEILLMDADGKPLHTIRRKVNQSSNLSSRKR